MSIFYSVNLKLVKRVDFHKKVC